MKLRTKKLAALGMSTMMMSSMAIGVQAAEAGTVNVNGNASGKASVSQSADIAVDGWINDTNPSDITSSYDESQSNKPQSSGASGGTNASTTSWGDESTKDTTQLIITAPTKLTFMAAGKGDKAKLVDTTPDGAVVKGQIVNQSCYVASDLSVVPKAVDVNASTKVNGDENFKLEKAEGENYVAGVNLVVGKKKTPFSDTVKSEQKVGTLPKGSVAMTSDKKQAVNGSKTDVYFAGSDNLETGFKADYDSNDSVKTSYVLGMTYLLDAGNRITGRDSDGRSTVLCKGQQCAFCHFCTALAYKRDGSGQCDLQAGCLQGAGS